MAAPALVGREKEYVLDCLESTWISSSGKYIEAFEDEFARFCKVKHAIACTNGTVGLHLGLLALGVGEGDEVIVPSLTYVATANVVRYCGARPVFCDIEPDTWNLSPDLVLERITDRTKAIIAVHLFGNPAPVDKLMDIATERGIFLIEDAAEAHGASLGGKPVGSMAHVGVFSFYGNKILTTGEGGMVTTGDASVARVVRLLRGQGVDPERRYWFPVVGYNYRLTNICAAIGLAQLERADWHVARRREIAGWYREELSSTSGITFQRVVRNAEAAYWMNSVVVNSIERDTQRDAIMHDLEEKGIETRPFFYPMHLLPPYRDVGTHAASLYNAERVAATGISLPSGALLEREDVAYVARCLRGALSGSK